MIGASVAYHLAARGVRDVVVLDRAAGPGAGSTGRATGGFRVQFANAIDVRLSLLAFDHMQRFAEDTGGDCGYVPAGYLWIATSESDLRGLHAAIAVQRACGVTNACEVDAREILALNPALAPGEILAGTFCPTDGFIRPLQILDGYRRAAERLGARFFFDAEVIALKRKGSRITHVQTPHDTYATDAVVNAAGPWAAAIAHLAGETLPVVPLRRQVALTVPTDVLPATMPMTIFVGDAFHLRVRDGRVLILMNSPGAADPFDDTVDPKWIEHVMAYAHRRLPVLADVAVDHAASWAGLYEQSPDSHAILGPALHVDNLLYANGSSGHGVMHAPALGMLLAEIMTGATPSIDIAALHPGRFAQPLGVVPEPL